MTSVHDDVAGEAGQHLSVDGRAEVLAGLLAERRSCRAFQQREVPRPVIEELLILAGISFGYADSEHPANGYRTARAPLSEVVTWCED